MGATGGRSRKARGRRGDEKGRASAAGAVQAANALAAPHLIALACVFVLLALLAIRQVGSVDAGFHLRAGEHILQGHGWPRTDPFTFTLGGHPYIDTSWGYQVTIALAHRVLGAPGLVLFHAGLVMGIFLLVCLTARLGPADPASLVVLLLAGVLASEMRFEARPELLSYFLLAAVLYVLHRHAERRGAPLWVLPAVFLVWANMHSLFILGWAALVCFVLGMWLRDRSLDRPLALWSAGSIAVAILNPYGWRGVVFPFTLATRMQAENPFAQSIGEFVSPLALRLSEQFPFYPRVPIGMFRLLAVLSLAALLPLILKRRFWCVLLWLVYAPLAARMIRNVPLLIVACLPGTIWGLHATGILDGLGLRGRAGRWLRAGVVGLSAAAALAVGLRVVNDAYYLACRREDRFGWSWNRIALPIDASRFAGRAGLRGPMLNHLNFGGTLMWWQREPVFIDGRLEVVGEAFFEEYRRALSSEQALEDCVARYGIRWLVFPYAISPELLGRVSRDRRWRLAYVDHLAALFVREGPEAEGLVDPALKRDLAAPPRAPDSRSLPGLGDKPRRSGSARWLSGFVSRQAFPVEDFNRGLFHLFRSEPETAGRFFARAIASSEGSYHEIYNDLAAALYRQRRYDEAAGCYRIVLEDDPASRVARERLAEIESRGH